MKVTLKRLFTILTIFAMSLCGTATAFAADTSDMTIQQEVAFDDSVSPRASEIVAFNSANFSGTYGEVYVYVDETLWGANFSCSVNGPNSTKSLGAGLLYPCSNFILLASSQFAGNCKFKSTPL